MSSFFDILKHINSKDGLDFEMKEYLPFLINRGLSNTIDTVFFADVMNRFHHLDKDIQYDFYFNAIPKGKRYGKWNKATINKNVDLIIEFYEVNRAVAESYLKIMSEDDIVALHEKNNKGGSS